ncbi:glycosyltransferase family 39 protein, partial [Patescibacteria group bacterium]|nr:glycosyltransferase family 39 protein [Patescibacteria group bacterium]
PPRSPFGHLAGVISLILFLKSEQLLSSLSVETFLTNPYNQKYMFKHLLKFFLLSQLILIIAWFLGEKFIPIGSETFLGKNLGESVDNSLLWSRANFDGVHHISIARSGYGYLQQAFFPFYAKLISFSQPLFKNFILSGIFVSLISFFLSLIAFADLLKLEGEKEETIKKSLLFLILFPTSFYFSFVYTESLFLFLVLLSFWLAKKQQWLLSGLAAGLASYTRLTGIFLLPALLYQYNQTQAARGMKERFAAVKKDFFSRFNLNYFRYFVRTRINHFKNLVFILFSSWGLLLYMRFLKNTTGDPLYFIRVQPDFGAQRSIGRIIMIYQVFWRYLKMIFTVNPRSFIYFDVWVELVITLIFLYLLLFLWFRTKNYRPWLIFSTLAYLLPSLTGTFSSMPRYVLACFPCFLILAKMKLPKVLYFISGLGFLIFSGLFMRGYWIA